MPVKRQRKSPLTKRKKSPLYKKQATATNSTASADLKRPEIQTWGATVATLKSIRPHYQYEKKAGTHADIPTQHIPTLPQANEAKAILDRIKAEFELIIHRRGYKVSSITEMCCCGDGSYHLNGGKHTKSMPNNVLGYNSCSEHTSYIHLRLRHAPSDGSREHHTLFPYEDVAGTMCHELAHCIHHNHGEAFYKLMDDIMEEYELLIERGIVISHSSTSSRVDGKQTNYWSSLVGGGYTLGGAVKRTTTTNYTLPPDKRKVILQAAENRCNRNKPTPLDTNMNHGQSLHTFLTPREAAAIAAECRWLERQRIDSQFCVPCEQIIQLLEHDSSNAKKHIIEILD